jgi:hypothetical protein
VVFIVEDPKEIILVGVEDVGTIKEKLECKEE